MDGVGAPAGADVPTASTARGAGAAGSSDPAVLKFALVSPPDADDEAVDASTGGARLDRTASLVMKLLRSHPELQVRPGRGFRSAPACFAAAARVTRAPTVHPHRRNLGRQI